MIPLKTVATVSRMWGKCFSIYESLGDSSNQTSRPERRAHWDGKMQLKNQRAPKFPLKVNGLGFLTGGSFEDAIFKSNKRG